MGNREVQVVHVHGLLGSKDNFQEQMNVDLGANQFAVDYWPFVEGKGQKLIDNIVGNTIAVLLEAYPEDTFILHGNSAGGFLATLVASHPEMHQKIAGVVLNCSAGLGENLESGNSGAAFGLLDTIRNDESQIANLIELFVQLPKEKIPQRLIEEIKALVLCENSREQLAKIGRRGQLFKNHADLVSESFREGLRILVQQSIPTLVIGGTNDRITPPDVMRKMAGLLDTSPIFLSTGHAAHIEDPIMFNKHFRKFISYL